MKKVISVLAVAAMLVAVASCKNQAAEEAQEAVATDIEVVEEVADSTAAVADSAAVEVVETPAE